MQKFENVDLLASLEAIMKTNTQHYQSDFNYDKEMLKDALQNDDPRNSSFLWMS